MVTTKSYDYLNRLRSISSAPSASSVVSFSYGLNSANQRVRSTLADGSYWAYEYDSFGQVKSGKRYWSDGTPVAGQQFEYSFDTIGNRTSTRAGGDENGANSRTNTYAANLLNQYGSRTVAGAADVIGAALPSLTVAVNNQTAYRIGEYFRKELSIANSSGPVWQSVTVTTNGQTAASGNLLVPKASETIWHDADGNLLSDSLWTNTWDAENRLVRDYEPRQPAGTGQEGADVHLRLPMAADIQDHLHEQRQRVRCVLHQLLRLRRLEPGRGPRSTVHGPPVFHLGNGFVRARSQGAGGVGGLLAMKVHSGANAGTYFYCYDGNGNAVALVNAAAGTVAAQYEYGPFGELLRATGPLAAENPFRFSTKYQDDETGLLYYGYRHHDPNTGRWISRDPIEEPGGVNLYGFVQNNAGDRVDYLGLFGGEFPHDVVPDPSHPGEFILTAHGTIRIPKCTILILIGHLRGMPGELTVEEKGSAYGEIYSCNSGGGIIESEGRRIRVTPLKTPGIPGAPKKPKEDITGNELADLAAKAFGAAKNAARKICKKMKCKCSEVTITTEGNFHPEEWEGRVDDPGIQRVISLIDTLQATIPCK